MGDCVEKMDVEVGLKTVCRSHCDIQRASDQGNRMKIFLEIVNPSLKGGAKSQKTTKERLFQ